jgi:hypothetical protein
MNNKEMLVQFIIDDYNEKTYFTSLKGKYRAKLIGIDYYSSATEEQTTIANYEFEIDGTTVTQTPAALSYIDTQDNHLLQIRSNSLQSYNDNRLFFSAGLSSNKNVKIYGQPEIILECRNNITFSISQVGSAPTYGSAGFDTTNFRYILLTFDIVEILNEF